MLIPLFCNINSNLHTKMAAEVTKFFSTLQEMILCPITKLEMTNPYVGTDHQSYEKLAISQWLSKEFKSPVTREPMQMHCLMPDYTMSKLIQTMKECQITDEIVFSLPPKQASSKPFDRGVKRKRKVARLKVNMKTKKAALKIMSNHMKYLVNMNFFNERYLKPSMPTKPSFSLMHSLKDGFSILMYSGSHRVALNPENCLHNYNAVRIILPEWMAIIWHEGLFHAGTRSRGTVDMRFFSYVWPHVFTRHARRTLGTMDGVAREVGDQVYRKDINDKICKDMYKENSKCPHCRRWEEVIDLREIPPSSYSNGERIVGCLETYGWVVVRGVRVKQETYDAIDFISQLGAKGRRTKKGTWTSIEDRGNNRKMKYHYTSNPRADWEADELCGNFLKDVENKVLGNVWKDTPLKDEQYILGKFNLIKNDGFIGLDQQAHTDYAPRLSK